MSPITRSKKFVDRKVQGAIVRRLALHWFSFLVVGLGFVLLFQFLMDPFTPLSEHVANLLKSQAGFLAVMLCMTPIFLYDSVKLTNRFAGPVLRLRRALHQLAMGEEVKPIKFRPGDFWIDMADDFNHALARVSAPSAQQPDTEEQVEDDAVEPQTIS